MRIFYLLLLFLMLACGQAHAQCFAFLQTDPASGGNPVAASCTTAQNSYSGASSTIYEIYGSRNYMGTLYLNSNAVTICKANLTMIREYTAENVAYNLSVCIYTNSCSTCDRTDDNVGSVVGTCSDAVSGQSIGTTEETVVFANMSAAVSASTYYWVVVKVDAITTEDVDNNVGWVSTSTGLTDMHYDADGSGAWSSLSTTRKGKFALYSN